MRLCLPPQFFSALGGLDSGDAGAAGAMLGDDGAGEDGGGTSALVTVTATSTGTRTLDL